MNKNGLRVSAWWRLLSLLLLSTLTLVSNNAWADGWTSAFTITSLYVSGPNNYAYRVYGFPPIAGTTCAGGGWAYINQGDAGASWYASALLTAYSTGKQVTLLVQVDGNGYCHIAEMTVSG